MIELRDGNLLAEDAEALVNTVNTVGVMGKGVALQFKQAFPENFRAYEAACRAGLVQTGSVFVVPTMNVGNPKYIINFPTKRNWRHRSKIEYIRDGLDSLIQEVKRLGITSIAVPPLGCGNGGLDWREVRPLIEEAFAEVPYVCVHLYEPRGAPAADSVLVRTRRPRMTLGRAVLIQLLRQYGEVGYRLSLLEVQKLAYFLQMAGTPLKLRFAKGKYGPYADNLNHVLQAIDGHFIRGYGDRSAEARIYLMPGAVEAADAALGNEASARDERERLERVARLIEGFETPYGMELLATVHWVANDELGPAQDVEMAVQAVHAWSSRKQSRYRPEHIRKAWARLSDQGWLGERSRQAVFASA